MRWSVTVVTAWFPAMVLVEPLHGPTFAQLHLACLQMLSVVVPPPLAATAQGIYGGPRCGGSAQRLRLLDTRPACGKCVRASGLIYRSQAVRTEKRHTVTAPPRLAMLNSDTPARIHPRSGRKLDRRANIEFGLRGSRIVARKHGVDRARDQGL